MNHLFEERNHIEGLLNTRFNFFLAIFATTIAALLAVENVNQLRIILIFSAVIETFFALVIGRAQLKLSIYLKRIRKNPKEAEYFGNRVANSKSRNPLINNSRNAIIGKYIPSVLSIILIISVFFSETIFDHLNKNTYNQLISLKNRIEVLETNNRQHNTILDSLLNIKTIDHSDSTILTKSKTENNAIR